MNSYNIQGTNDEKPHFIFLEKIKAMFITIIEKEKISKDLKISLTNSPNLNLMNYFKEIDTKDRGYIDVKDLQIYLQNKYISFNESTVRRFIHQYDKSQKFHLIYEHFCLIFQPYNHINDNLNKKGKEMKERELFLNILSNSLDLIEQINGITNDIRKTNNFTTYEAFMGITKGNKYLDEEFMTHFLDHKYDKEEIRNLIYLIDLNNDSLISYEEFQDFFIPLISYTEKVDINNNNFDYNENINDNENYEEINNDEFDNNINFDSNDKVKNDADIVNYEKSGKFRGKNSNYDKKEKNIKNINNDDLFNYEENNDKKYYSTFSQKLNKEKKISPNKTIKMELKYKKYMNNYNDDNDYEDKNYKSMNNLKYNQNNFNNYIQKENELKSSQESDIKETNNYYNDDLSDNNNYDIDLDNDCDEYCKFYKKTQKILTSSQENKERQKSINKLQNTPNFNYKEISSKKEKNKFNDNYLTKDKEYFNKYGNENRDNNVYKNIKRDNDYIINILDDNKNNFRNNKKKYDFNIIHTEVQYIPKNKNFKIEKKEEINLSNRENNNKNYNYIQKEEKIENLNNFTCGPKTESGKDSSSLKKMNLYNNNNYNESYSLSNQKNKISKNINISHTHDNNSHNNDLEEENNIRESLSDKINKETLIKKLKENNNSSLTNFIKYIQFLVKNEKKTIDIKDKLCLREDVTLKDLFCIFDYNKKNNISKTEFKSVCKKLFGLYPTSDQIVLVFKRYDKNKDDNLNIREFLRMIKPIKEEYTSFLFNKKISGNKNGGYQKLTTKTKKLLIELIKNIIEDEGNYYKLKDEIEQNSFELKQLWENIFKYSNDNKGLDKIEMNKLLNDNGCSLSQYDLDILFNKMDFDDDQIISYEDLEQEFVNYY